jgi:hypothetical protein
MDNMKKPTKKEINAKINAIDKERYKLNKQTRVLQDELQKRDSEDEVTKLTKLKYAKRTYGTLVELVYIHSIKMNKRFPMSSTVKLITVTPYKNAISCHDTTVYQLRGYKPAKQDEFVKAYTNLMKDLDLRLPLIKKTKVGL